VRKVLLELRNDRTDGPETRGVGVVEDQLVDAHRGIVGRDRRKDLGDPKSTSAENAELHTVMTSALALRTAAHSW
jgi:hypothetical protein